MTHLPIGTAGGLGSVLWRSLADDVHRKVARTADPRESDLMGYNAWSEAL